MSVTTTPGKGVKISLNAYARLRISRTGPDFWYIDNQKLLCEKLAPFLPRMDYDSSDNSVTAQRIESGKEKLGDSVAANPNFSNVPADQVRLLRAVIAGFLQELTEHPSSSPMGRLGEAFTLPIPSKAPELYRLYGTGKNKKLAIIWGVSKTDSAGNEDINSVATLQQMLHILPNPRKENPFIMLIVNTIETICKLPRNVRFTLLGIVVALIVLMSWVCCSSDSEGAIPPQPAGQPTTGMQPAGQPTTGMQTAGQPTTGIQPAGQPTTGMQPAGQPTTGIQPVGQPTTGMQPAGQPAIRLSVGNMPCEISVSNIKQANDGNIHITFKVSYLNHQQPYKVYIDKQEVTKGTITLAYKKYPKKINVSAIPTKGASPINAELTISEN
ncbi:MAG: hypothetical protein IJ943_00775 [Akkermansia sp.]|nr:hypothetical protein [Akkermansia sp.]